MDSRKSIEFITELIKQASTDPQVRAVLKKASLMSRTAQVMAGIDDGHLENLYSMNVNRGGAAMFVKTLQQGNITGKAPKGLVIQSHPNYLKDIQKYFPSAVAFAVTNMSQTITDWSGETSQEKQMKTQHGFYNDMPALIDFLKKAGLTAPFEIKVGKNSLQLTCYKKELGLQTLLADLLASSKQMAKAMKDEDKELALLDELETKIVDLEAQIKEEKNLLSQLRTEWTEMRSRRSAVEDEMRRKTPNDPNYDTLLQLFNDRQEDMDKLTEKQTKKEIELQKAEASLIETQSRFEMLYDEEKYDRAEKWHALDWNGSDTPNAHQMVKLITMAGRRYQPLLKKLPQEEKIVVDISCAIKSSSKGFKEGTFKHLSDFIKFTIF
jgi:hypothetical protein